MPSSERPSSDSAAGPATDPPFAGVLLTGGTGRRLGGVDKASVELDRRRLLDHALEALAEADPVVVVGPATEVDREVVFVREDPPGSGPAAGLLAGVEHVIGPDPGPVAGPGPDWVAVLAVDMPRVSADSFRRLLAAAAGRDGAFLLDPEGYRQLCGVVRTDRLLEVAPPAGSRDGLSVRRLLAPLDLYDLPAVGQEAHDVDTWEDLERLGGRPLPPH